jgi:hypothetical protein
MSFTQGLYGVLFGMLALVTAGCAGPAGSEAPDPEGDARTASSPGEALSAGDEALAEGAWPAAFAEALAQPSGQGRGEGCSGGSSPCAAGGVDHLVVAPTLTAAALRGGALCPVVLGSPLESMAQPTPCETCHGLIAR